MAKRQEDWVSKVSNYVGRRVLSILSIVSFLYAMGALAFHSFDLLILCICNQIGVVLLALQRES